MDHDTDTLCPGCFADKDRANPCPHCGYDETAQRATFLLPHRTLLNGQFVVGRVLGKPGGFGVTYLGWDLSLATRVAIKEYLPRDLVGRTSDRATLAPHSREEDEQFRFGLDQFMREARTLAQIDHPNIVRVRHFFEANGTAYLVMDYYRGLSLAEYLERHGGRLPEQAARALMFPLLDGLRAVHAKGFLHRDIKPQNIYLARTESGGARPLLLDFGAARQAMGERSRSLSVVLTPGFAPFEQYHRKGRQGPWTDIYGAAAVLYLLVTGETPPEANERMAGDELKPASSFGVTQTLSDALGAALALTPEARPQAVPEFQAMLADREARESPAPVLAEPPVAVVPRAVPDPPPPRAEPAQSVPVARAAGNKAERAKAPARRPAPRPASRWWPLGLGAVMVLLSVLVGVVAYGVRKENSFAERAARETAWRQAAADREAAEARAREADRAAEKVRAAEARAAEVARAAKEARAAKAARVAETMSLLEMVNIPAGSFLMGCTQTDRECLNPETPAHRVAIKSFRIGRSEVTQALWYAIMGKNPSKFTGRDRPVEHVSWNDIQEFLRRLNAGGTGKPYRLPTEAEWEYAARAGATTRYWWGTEIGSSQANCKGCGSRWDGQETSPVGSFRPNAFGLYDTVGNVEEWVQDCWHDTYSSAPTDGSEWLVSCLDARRVVRGGSFRDDPAGARASSRLRYHPDHLFDHLGLRLAQDL